MVKNGKVVIALSSPLNNESDFWKEHSDHIAKHGDGVRDVAFHVENCETTFKVAISRGAKAVKEVTKLTDENGGVVYLASVQAYNDTIHTFVQRENFNGVYLPGFIALKEDAINEIVGTTEYGFIDHVVGNHPLGDMEISVQYYEKILDFHRYWSIDDSIIHTEYR